MKSINKRIYYETLKSKLQSYEKDIDQLQEQLNKYDNQIEIDKTDEFEI